MTNEQEDYSVVELGVASEETLGGHLSSPEDVSSGQKIALDRD